MDAIWQMIVDVELTTKLHRVFGGVLLGKNDKLANRMGARVCQDGQAVNLSGYTVKGYFIRNGTETIVLNGTISGNQAYVDLDAKCYHKDGSYTLSVVLCKGGREQTLVIFDGRIAETGTDTIVENENTLSLADLAQQEWVENVLDAADVALEQANKAAESAAQAQAIKDSIPPDYTEVVKQIDQKAQAIFVDASGDIVQITDGAEGMPVKRLKTTIVPKEDCTGWDAVNVTGTGKNLFGGKALAEALKALSPSTITIDENAGTVTFNAGNAGSKRLFYVKNPASRYTVVLTGKNSLYTHSNIVFYYTDGTYSAANFESINTVSTIVAYSTPGKQVQSVGVILYGGSTVLYYNECGLFEGILTKEDFEAYKGKTLIEDLPETVYGGKPDWVSGVLTVTHAVRTLNGTESTWTNYSAIAGCTVQIGAMRKSHAAQDFWCDIYPTAKGASFTESAVMCGYNNSNYLYWQNVYEAFGVADLAGWKAYLQEHPAKIVYPLAEPYTIQLTPQQLETLKGTNNIWSDAGETEVTYAADTKMYIDQKIAAIAAAIV